MELPTVLRQRTTLRSLPILLGLALGPAACGRSCGCVEGEKTYETLDGKVKVSLVRKVIWTGGKVPGPRTTFFVRVGTEPPFDEQVHGCDHVDLAEDDAGKNVAFRCVGTGPWTVLRLRGGDRHIRECDATIGTGERPMFDKLRPVREAGMRILDCTDSDQYYRTEQVVRAIVEDDGADAAADFVVELAARRLPPSYVPDPWNRALAALDPPARARTMAGLCGALRATAPPPPAATYVRAAMRCPLDVAAVGDGALAMLAKLLDETPTPPPDADGGAVRESSDPDENVRALLWSALLGSEKDPRAAGELACKAAPRLAWHETAPSRARRKQLVAWLLGTTNTPCKEIDHWLTPPPCSDKLDCDGGALCTRADIATETSSWKDLLGAPPDGGVREEPYVPYAERLTLFAAYARGALPDDLVRVNARRSYDFADAGDLPPCDDDDLDAGAPCRCPHLPAYTRCWIEANATRTRYQYCSIHIDDAHRRFDDVKRACEGEGAKCDSSTVLCCGGLRCDPAAWVCQRAPARTTPTDAGDAQR